MHSDPVILAEDAGVLIVDKPAGVLTVPAPGRAGRTLVDHVTALLSARTPAARALAVHRLDEETSGAVAFALDEATRVELEALFARHDVTRVYHAIVVGRPHPPAGVIRTRLAIGADDLAVATGGRGGQNAVTYYRVVAWLGGDYALVECELETGRRNQIRAHLAHHGWPLAGDRKYGVFHGHKKELSRRAPRTMLHATALALALPGARRVVGVAPFPADFAAFVEAATLGRLLTEVAARVSGAGPSPSPRARKGSR